jgi:hypothetical protein
LVSLPARTGIFCQPTANALPLSTGAVSITLDVVQRFANVVVPAVDPIHHPEDGVTADML